MIFEAKYKAIKRKVTTIGFLGTMKLILKDLRDWVFFRDHLLYYVDIQSYSASPEKMAPFIVGKEINCIDGLSQGDIIEIKNYAGENCIKEFKRRFSNNWRLFLAYSDNHVAGACWVIDNSSEFRTKVVPLFDGDIALIDAWTIPSFRGKNVYSFLLSFIIKQFKGKKLGRAFGYAYERNMAAVRGQKKVGLQYFIHYESYRLFSYEIVIWKPKGRRAINIDEEAKSLK